MAQRSLTVKVIGDAASFEKAVRKSIAANKDLDKSFSITSKAGSAFSKSMVFAAGSLLGGAGFVGAATKAVNAASDLEEQITKTGVVFGAGAKQVHEWSKTTASSLGIARDKALEATGTFGNMLVPMGFAREKAADMSVTMVQLASDMASFNNASPEETLNALRSGLAGETEPLRRFGVFLSDATVKQEALNMGLYTGKGNLDAAGKAAASYSLILKQTKDAQGDMERTGGGLANQQRKLSALIRDTEAGIGQALLPTVTKITAAMTGWLGKTENQEKIQAAANKTMRVAGDIVEAVWPKVQMVAKAADQVAQAVGGWDKALMLITGGVLLNKVTALGNGFGGKAGLAGGVFRATSSLTGKGGLLGALNAIPAAIVTTITIREIVQKLTGSEAAGNVAGGAAGGSILGGVAGKAAGKALAGAKYGGAAGAVAAELVNPSDKLGAGTVPVWDGRKFAGVTAAGSAYWLGQRKAAGLGAPVVGQGPFYRGAAGAKPSTSSSTTATAQGRYAYDAPQDYSGLGSSGGGGGGGGGGGKGSDASADGDGPTVGSWFKRAGDAMGPIADAAAERQAALLARLGAFDIRNHSTQWGPMSGFSADSIVADKSRAAEAAADVKARIDAMRQAVDAKRSDFSSSFSRLGEAAQKAIEAKYATMQRNLTTALQAQMKEIERARAELTPAERELQQVQDARAEQDRNEALTAAQASGDTKQIEAAQYAVRIAALQKRAEVERRERDNRARELSEAAQGEYETQREILNEQLTTEKTQYQEKLDALGAYLALRAETVTDANDKIKEALGEFAIDLDRQIAETASKLQQVYAAGDIRGALAPGAKTAGEAMRAAFPNFYPQASGGDYLVNGPTMFLAGEAGPERATFSPIGGRDYHGSGTTVIVNVAGNVTSERDLAATIRGELIRGGIAGATTSVVARSRTGV